LKAVSLSFARFVAPNVECPPFKFKALISKPVGDLVLVSMNKYNSTLNWWIRVGTDDINLITNTTEDYFFDMLHYKGGVFVDVGAHIGLFTIKAGAKCKDHIVSIEPDPKNFELLTRNITLNKLTNVNAFWNAVYSTSGELILHTSTAHSDGASLSPRANQQISVKILSKKLDDFTQSEKSIEVLKIDVEGSEIEVLAGASCTLKKALKVLIEVEAANLLPVSTILKSAGFEVQDLGLFYSESVNYLLAVRRNV
jgi:FkbM family methyltransferase